MSTYPCCFGVPGGASPYLSAAGLKRNAPTDRARQKPIEFYLSVIVRVKNKNSQKTFNNGSLGSGIDEERSEMR